MIEVDNKYIDSAVDELIQLLGVKESIEYGLLQNMLEEDKAKDCVEAIAHTMALPISVVISYVPSVYRGTSTPGQGFTSQEIVKMLVLEREERELRALLHKYPHPPFCRYLVAQTSKIILLP